MLPKFKKRIVGLYRLRIWQILNIIIIIFAIALENLSCKEINHEQKSISNAIISDEEMNIINSWNSNNFTLSQT
jgi:hypothetical protein